MRAKITIWPILLCQPIGGPNYFLNHQPREELDFFTGCPSFRHRVWHRGVDSAHELCQVSGGRGGLIVLHVLPDDIVFGMLPIVEPLENSPKVYELSYMLEGEVDSDLYLGYPHILVEHNLDFSIFPRGCLKNKGRDLLGFLILHPRCLPKRVLGSVADSEYGGGI